MDKLPIELQLFDRICGLLRLADWLSSLLINSVSALPVSAAVTDRFYSSPLGINKDRIHFCLDLIFVR